jgi:hypothetical protein
MAPDAPKENAFRMTLNIPDRIRLSTLLKCLAVALIATLLVRGYYWRENVNTRGYHSDLSYSYLADGFKGPDGKIYNRSQVLDALVQNALRQAVQAQQQKAALVPGPEPKKK